VKAFMADDYVIDVHKLNKRFNGRPAVENLSLKVKKRRNLRFSGS